MSHVKLSLIKLAPGSRGVANYFGESLEEKTQFQNPFRRPHSDPVRPDAESQRRRQEESIRRTSIRKSDMLDLLPVGQMWPLKFLIGPELQSLCKFSSLNKITVFIIQNNFSPLIFIVPSLQS